MPRAIPNILITGTPGVGKSTFSRKLAAKTKLHWLDVSNYAEMNGYVTGEPDPVYRSRILDEDRLLDSLEEKIRDGGYIVDHHCSDLFPVRWFDLVVVLIVGNTVLYDRLSTRGYTGKKLEDNVECEIFQTILEDVRESFNNDIIRVYTNVTPEDMRQNLQMLSASVNEWISASTSTSEASVEIPLVEEPEAEQLVPVPQLMPTDDMVRMLTGQAPPEMSLPDTKVSLPDTEVSLPDTKMSLPDSQMSVPDEPAEDMESSEVSDTESDEALSSETGSLEPEFEIEVVPRQPSPGPQVPRPSSPVPESLDSDSSAEQSDSNAPEPQVSDDEDE